MIQPASYALANGITESFLLELAWDMIRKPMGDMDQPSENLRNVLKVVTIADASSANQEIPVPVKAVAARMAQAYLGLEVDDTLPPDLDLFPWECLARWAAFSVQCSGEDQSRTFLEHMKQRMETADVNRDGHAAGTHGNPAGQAPARPAAEEPIAGSAGGGPAAAARDGKSPPDAVPDWDYSL